ncbi:hypothetical protein ONZ45_g7369 [Pleurotus djamor]|nr:hypothetical protein ONZ45_g7369 [Pleurotus djamor]
MVTATDSQVFQAGLTDCIAEVQATVRQLIQDTMHTQRLVENQQITVDYLAEYLNRTSDRLANVSLATGASVNSDGADWYYQTEDRSEPRESPLTPVVAERLPKQFESHTDPPNPAVECHSYSSTPLGPYAHNSPLSNTSPTPTSLGPYPSVAGSQWYYPDPNLYPQPTLGFPPPDCAFWPQQPGVAAPPQASAPGAPPDPTDEHLWYVDGNGLVRR